MTYFTHVNDLNVICYLSADFIISAIHLITEPCQFLSFGDNVRIVCNFVKVSIIFSMVQSAKIVFLF